LTSKTPRRSASTGTVSRQLGARPARDFGSGQTLKAPGHPTGNRGCWSHHRTASAASWRRAAYTRSRVNFQRDSDRIGSQGSCTSVHALPVRGTRLRFGGGCALTSLSAIASAVARAVQVLAHRAQHPTSSWQREGGGLQATRRRGAPAGVRTELRTLASRPWFGGWWERGSSGHHQNGP
jgi:hypothetical protein